MPWFYVDDAFADSKPVMKLDQGLRNEAVGLWVRCGAWSAKEETDGLVPVDVVKGFNGTPRLIRALHDDAGLWVQNGPDSWQKSRQIQFGSWEKWQKTRAQNIERREREAKKKSTWRSSKKGRDYVPNGDDAELSTGDNMVDNDDPSNGVSTGDDTALSRYPDPDPDPEKGGRLGNSSLASNTSPPSPSPTSYPDHCAKHRHDPDPPNCGACKQTRTANTAAVERAEAVEAVKLVDARLRENARRAACLDCDEHGWLYGDDQLVLDPACRCTHPDIP